MSLNVIETKRPLRDYRVKDEIIDSFLVKHIQLMEARDGRHYLNLILADQSGEVEARKWTDAESILEQVQKNDIVKIKGKLNLFQQRLQLIVEAVEKIVSITDLPEEHAHHFIAKSARPADEMFNQLVDIVDHHCKDVYIKDLLLSIVYDHEINRRLKIWSAGKSIHHAYQSGLLEHILSCCQLAVTMSEHYHCNKSLVIAGCILHDLCKIYELTEGPNVEYTEEGKLIGHLVKGLEIVDQFAQKIGHFPYDLKTHLKHILLAHHGELNYGSPKVPLTREAYLVHLIDYTDSKMNAMEMIRNQDQGPSRWSQFNKHLDRAIYKDELPFYENYVGERTEKKIAHPRPQERVVQSKTIANELVSEKKTRPTSEGLKQNLGSLLKDIKLS